MKAARRHQVPVLLLVGILLVALTLRGPIIAVAPVIDSVRAGLRIGAGTAGLLTSLPVLCFGVTAPLALALIDWLGLDRAVLMSILIGLIGLVGRSSDGVALALTGTILLGAAITVGNVAIPVIIGRDFAGLVGPVTAAYTAALNVGSMVTSSLTVPIAAITGWRIAIAGWGALGVAAAVVWARATAGRVPTAPTIRIRPDYPPRPAWRRPLAWGLALAFGCQAFSYYGVTAWLPNLLADERGLSRQDAGLASSIFQIVAVVGAFGVPALAARGVRAAAAMLVVCGCWIALPLGLILAPAAWPLWCVLGGAAQGGGITVIFILIVDRSNDTRESRQLSTLVQCGGYVIGASGPAIVGAVHEATGGWVAPMAVVALAITVMATIGTISARRPRSA